MEEVDFFHEICLISLYASRAVKFAAVVDSKGKLILAKFKKFHIDSHRASLLSARKIQHTHARPDTLTTILSVILL